jgi:putative ABC transport system substrate-binding protein
VRSDVAAIYAPDVPAAFAAKAATETIPIVFAIGADPIKVGLVDSPSRPKSNVTGVSAFISVLGPKRVELLHELSPTVDTIALLANSGNVNIKTDEPEIRAALIHIGWKCQGYASAGAAGFRPALPPSLVAPRDLECVAPARTRLPT